MPQANAETPALSRVDIDLERADIDTQLRCVKVANISGTGTGPRNNGTHFLQAEPTVANDSALDEHQR